MEELQEGQPRCEEWGDLREKRIKKGIKKDGKGFLGFEGEDGNSHLAQVNPAGLQHWNNPSIEETLGWRRFHLQEDTLPCWDFQKVPYGVYRARLFRDFLLDGFGGTEIPKQIQDCVQLGKG